MDAPLPQNTTQPIVGYFHPACLLSSRHARHRVDFRSITIAELKQFEVPFSFAAERTGALRGCATARVAWWND